MEDVLEGVWILVVPLREGRLGDEADGERSCERFGKVEETDLGPVMWECGVTEETDRRSVMATDLLEATEATDAFRDRDTGREGSGP